MKEIIPGKHSRRINIESKSISDSSQVRGEEINNSLNRAVKNIYGYNWMNLWRMIKIAFRGPSQSQINKP
jgi:hypothetical protein